MSSYILPSQIRSPKNHWKTVMVLDDGKDGRMAVAIGEWTDDECDHVHCIAMRWNGQTNKPKGNPISRGYPTWFIVGEEGYARGIIEHLPKKNVLYEGENLSMTEIANKFLGYM